LISDSSDIFKSRKRMRDAGLVVITLVFDKNLDLALEPVINFPGVLSDSMDGAEIGKIKRELFYSVKKNKQNFGGNFKDSVRKMVGSFIRKILHHQLGKKPVTIINIENARA